MPGLTQFVGSAGQYYVAYGLTVRGVHAAITIGNVPDVDVVASAADGSRLLAIQVKTSSWAHRPNRYRHELREWDVGSRAVGRFSATLWYAFVDLQHREGGYAPKVFFVPSAWVAAVVKEDWERKMFMLRAELWSNCEECWQNVGGFLNDDPGVKAWIDTVPREVTHWSNGSLIGAPAEPTPAP